MWIPCRHETTCENVVKFNLRKVEPCDHYNHACSAVGDSCKWSSSSRKLEQQGNRQLKENITQWRQSKNLCIQKAICHKGIRGDCVPFWTPFPTGCVLEEKRHMGIGSESSHLQSAKYCSLRPPPACFNQILGQWQALNPFMFIRSKLRIMSSMGFSALEKTRRDMSSESCAAHPVGYNSPTQIKRALGALFCIWLNFLGRLLQHAAYYNGCLARFKFKKKCTKRPFLSATGCHTQPNHSAK